MQYIVDKICKYKALKYVRSVGGAGGGADQILFINTWRFFCLFPPTLTLMQNLPYTIQYL